MKEKIKLMMIDLWKLMVAYERAKILDGVDKDDNLLVLETLDPVMV